MLYGCSIDKIIFNKIIIDTFIINTFIKWLSTSELGN